MLFLMIIKRFSSAIYNEYYGVVKNIWKRKEKVSPDTTYSAVKATDLLNNESYNTIKNILIIESQWIYEMKEMEIKRITLKLV